MKKSMKYILCSFIFTMFFLRLDAGDAVFNHHLCCRADDKVTYKMMIKNDIPQEEKGMEKGVSAMFAGVDKGYLLMAGGANFPHTPAAKGGKKVYYQGIYARSLQGKRWIQIGELPSPMAYGASVITPSGLVCIGGCNEQGASKSVICLYIDTIHNNPKLNIRKLPSLPVGVDNSGAALLSNTIYLAGGVSEELASKKVYALNLDKLAEGWKEVAPLPGAGKSQPIVVSQIYKGKPALYVWGGFSVMTTKKGRKKVQLDMNGYRYNPATNDWTKVAPARDADGKTVFLGGGAGCALPDGTIMATGGVQKDIFKNALKALPIGYLEHPKEWYQFNNRLFVYAPDTNKWRIVDTDKGFARAGASLVKGDDTYYYMGGELKPGIRTPDTLIFQMTNQ